MKNSKPKGRHYAPESRNYSQHKFDRSSGHSKWYHTSPKPGFSDGDSASSNRRYMSEERPNSDNRNSTRWNRHNFNNKGAQKRPFPYKSGNESRDNGKIPRRTDTLRKPINVAGSKDTLEPDPKLVNLISSLCENKIKLKMTKSKTKDVADPVPSTSQPRELNDQGDESPPTPRFRIPNDDYFEEQRILIKPELGLSGHNNISAQRNFGEEELKHVINVTHEGDLASQVPGVESIQGDIRQDQYVSSIKDASSSVEVKIFSEIGNLSSTDNLAKQIFTATTFTDIMNSFPDIQLEPHYTDSLNTLKRFISTENTEEFDMSLLGIMKEEFSGIYSTVTGYEDRHAFMVAKRKAMEEKCSETLELLTNELAYLASLRALESISRLKSANQETGLNTECVKQLNPSESSKNELCTIQTPHFEDEEFIKLSKILGRIIKCKVAGKTAAFMLEQQSVQRLLVFFFLKIDAKFIERYTENDPEQMGKESLLAQLKELFEAYLFEMRDPDSEAHNLFSRAEISDCLLRLSNVIAHLITLGRMLML